MAGDEYGLPGADAFVLGVKLTVALALLVLFTKYGDGIAEGYAFLARAAGQDAASAVTGIVLLGLLLAILLLAVPVYATLHTADVAIETPTGAVPVGPGLFGLPDPVYLVPPLVLVWAGFRRGNAVEKPTVEARLRAGATVAGGYLFLALVAIVPSTWLFDAVVNDVFLSEVPSAAGSVSVVIRNPVVAHLLVGVAYPLVFGAAGGLVAHAAAGDAGRDSAADGGPASEEESTLRRGDESRGRHSVADRTPGGTRPLDDRRTGDGRGQPGDGRRRSGDGRRRPRDDRTPHRDGRMESRDDRTPQRDGRLESRDDRTQPRDNNHDWGPSTNTVRGDGAQSRDDHDWGPASGTRYEEDRPG